MRGERISQFHWCRIYSSGTVGDWEIAAAAGKDGGYDENALSKCVYGYHEGHWLSYAMTNAMRGISAYRGRGGEEGIEDESCVDWEESHQLSMDLAV